MPVELTRQVAARLGVTVLEGYGLSETSPVATFSPPGQPPRVGSIGVPVWGVEVKLIDEDWNRVTTPGEVGEIAIKGPNVMKGYLNRPEATAAVIRGGWFRTGDLARQDADGYFYIIDRTKDMIIRGGFNVYPREIEEALFKHPHIRDAAVIGVPDAYRGEALVAYVVTDGSTVSEQALLDYLAQHLVKYKWPAKIHLVDSLPNTSVGKIDKKRLRVLAKETKND